MKSLFAQTERCVVPEFKGGLLKWVGNKQKFAHVIASYFPKSFGTFYEPFLGSAGMLGTLAPDRAFASDSFEPLIEIWQALARNPSEVKEWYRERWHFFTASGKRIGYASIRESYNAKPNGPDLLFLCRACYGGIVRFRKSDGHMSTPCGIHDPIRPAAFEKRVDEWASRIVGTQFQQMHYADAMRLAQPGDLVYCDPPYADSQSILYGAQAFDLLDLMSAIADCKQRGVFVALSIDGTKKSGQKRVSLPIPRNLFESEVMIDCGVSMLRRFQRGGETLGNELVADRLLLTYPL